MRFHQEARRDRYDVIVVGSGIGGLTAAAKLAQAGGRVLVVERHDRVGGYAHAFRRGRRIFDSAVHLVGRRHVETLLEDLAVADRCELLDLDPFYTFAHPELTLRVPGDVAAFTELHVDTFPGEEKGIRGFLTECLDIARETAESTVLDSPTSILRTPERFPSLLRHRRATVADVLDAQVRDPMARAALTALWPYLGLPPGRLSFLYFATMLLSYLDGGAVSCRGSFQQLAKALAFAIESRGGEILLRSPVRRIRVDEGRAVGVVLENGQPIEAPVVISNVDARQTAFELVGREAFPVRMTRQLERMRESISGAVSYLAVDRSAVAGLGHETFFYGHADHERAYQDALAGQPSWFTATVPTGVDPDLAPPDEALVVLTTLIGADTGPWPARKDELADALLDAAEARLPGLRGRVRFRESATPRTLERYTRNGAGALYGFELSPSQVGPGRPDTTTPLPGLFLAGHWTQPGGGITGVITSGLQCAAQVARAVRQ